jgi:hypothetical protein
MFDRSIPVRIEICTNPEWVTSAQLRNEDADEAAGLYFEAAYRVLTKSKLFATAKIGPASPQRNHFHGWNGAHWFNGYSSGAIGSMWRMGPRRRAVIDAAAAAGREAIQPVFDRAAADHAAAEESAAALEAM